MEWHHAQAASVEIFNNEQAIEMGMIRVEEKKTKVKELLEMK